MSSIAPSQAAPRMGAFERNLTWWVFSCITAGIGLGQLFPGFFRQVGALKLAEVNLPVAVLIWLMIVPMLLKVDFGALHQVRAHARGNVGRRRAAQGGE